MVRQRWCTLWVPLFAGVLAAGTSGCRHVLHITRPAVTVFAAGQARVYLSVDTATAAALRSPQPFMGDAPADLPRCFRLLTGADLPTQPSAGRIPLRLLLLDPAQDARSASPLGHQGYLVEVSDREIVLAAPTAVGLFNAIWHVLDHWGCRWIMPGDEGEVIPRQAGLELPAGTFRKNNSLDARCVANAAPDYATWRARNGCGTAAWLAMSHYWPVMVPPETYFTEHPEYFALVNGQRVPTQLETANPELVALLQEKSREWLRASPLHRASVPMEFSDNLDYSTSPESLALDPPGNPLYMGIPSMSDRLVTLANQMGEAIEEEFPDKVVAMLGYSHHTLPPVKARPRRNVVVALTRTGCCLVHLVPRPADPASATFWRHLAGWQQVCPRMYTYDWVPLYWAGGLPCPLFLEYPRALKRAAALGVKGNYSEKPARCDAADFVGDYLEWRIKADPSREPEAELRDLCTVFFGPAGPPMNRYYLALAKATDSCLPGTCFDAGTALVYPDLYTPAVISAAREHLERAAVAAADDATYGNRVRMVRLTFDYLQAFLTGAWEARKGNYEASVASFDATRSSLEALHALQPTYVDLAYAEAHLETARLKTLARHFPDRLGFCRSWQVLGPLANPYRDADLPDGLFPPKVFPAGARVGAPARLADGTDLAWQPYTSPEGLVDFTAAFAATPRAWSFSHAYAALTVETSAAQAVHVCLDSFYPFRVFVNGTQVYHRPGLNQDMPDRYRIPVTLQAGRNDIVVRSSETVPPSSVFRWGFYFRLTTPDGKPAPDVRIAADSGPHVPP